jgi:hypothetical protein
MHGFWLDPMDGPFAGMTWLLDCRNVANGLAGAMITNVWATSAGIPVDKQARPAMMMHWYGFTWLRNVYFQDPNQHIFEEDLVAPRCSQYGIIAIRKVILILSAEIEAGEEQQKRKDGGCRQKYFLQ